MNKNTRLIFIHSYMWPGVSIFFTCGNKQGLTVRMIICSNVSMVQYFDDVITKSASKYQFIRVLLCVK